MTQEELLDVEAQIQELELTQEALLAENKRLKEHLNSKPTLVHLQNYAATLRKLRTDLCRLTAVAKAIKANQPLTLNLIMGGKEELAEVDQDENSLAREVDRLKDEVLSLRNCLSDLYAEQCGSLCTQQ